MIDIKPVYKFVEEELELLNKMLVAQGGSEYKLVREIVSHIVSKGKRIRPILVFLIAKAFGVKNKQAVVSSAFAVELIHTASLLHDDVVDETKKRRGKKTANVLWGNKETILVGDHLFTQSFLAIVSLQNFEATQIIANASSRLTIGEITQLENERNINLTMKEYLDIIYHKTASLFEASAKLGALFSENGNQGSCAQFGKNLGFAFQMMDDILDYTGSVTIGKDIGTDFKERKVTLPILILMENANNDELLQVQKYFATGKDLSLHNITSMIKKHNVIAKCYEVLGDVIQQAQRFVNEEIHDNKTKEIINNLLAFLTKRVA
jgi:octaprenyl-diphosphate synthase